MWLIPAPDTKSTHSFPTTIKQIALKNVVYIVLLALAIWYTWKTGLKLDIRQNYRLLYEM